MTTYDKRPPRAEAEALVRRRIDASRLRHVKADFGLAEANRLADHFELVVIVREQMPGIGLTPYYVRQWGVKVGGRPAGYVATNYAGTRDKFLPYGWGWPSDKTREVPEDQAPAPPDRQLPEPAEPDPGPWFSYQQLAEHRYQVMVRVRGRLEPYLPGVVQRFGSLPSMQHWQGLGDWAGSGWTRSCQSREASRPRGVAPAPGARGPGRIMTGLPSTAYARSLLGQQVRVALDLKDGACAPVTEGKLIGFGDGGDFEILDDEGFVHYCWPMLRIEPRSEG